MSSVERAGARAVAGAAGTERRRAEVFGPEWTARWMGVAAAVLFGVGSALWGLDMPEGGAPPRELAAFYRDNADAIVWGASLSLVGIAAFVVFAAAIRRLLADADGDDTLATEAFGGALIVAAVGLGAETINMVGALRARDGTLTPELAQTVFAISQPLGSAAAAIGVAIFAMATAFIALRTGAILPRWLAIAVALAALVLLTPVGWVQEVAGASVVVITLLVALGASRTAP